MQADDPVRPWPELVACLALVAALGGCGGYRWESKGPFQTSGAIRHVIIDPSQGTRLYAAAENGGVWVLDDVDKAGMQWRPLSDELENLQMRGLAKSKVNPDYLVAANALGFVYHSKDHGETWDRVTNQNFQYVRRIHMIEGLTRIPAGNYSRLAKETLLWIASRLGLYRIRLVNDAFDSVEQIYPTDATQQGDVLDVVLHPTDPEILFIGERGQGVWRTQNGGDDWELSASWAAFGDPPVPMIKLAMTANGGRIAAKLGRTVIINDQGGDPAAWQQTAPVPWAASDVGGSDIGYRGNYSGSPGEWDHAIALHPTDPQTIVVGQNALFLSDDGGATWSPINGGHEDTQSLAFSPSGGSLYIANDGGVFRRNMATGTRSDLNAGLVTFQFYRVGVRRGAAVGNADHQGIWGTRDLQPAAPVWERATTSASGFGNNALENDFVFADPTTAGRYFVAFQSQHLLRLRFPPTGSTEDLLPLNPPATLLRPFTARTNNNPVFNQLNYAVGTLAVDPRQGANTILTAVHTTLNATFGIAMTRDGNADPSGGPRNDCGDANGNTFCFTPPVAGTATWTTTFNAGGTPIVSIVFSPTEPRKVVAMDEAGRIIVKNDIDDDAGAWTVAGNWAVPAGDFARQLVADISSPQRLYAISHRAFVRSTNGGADWAAAGQATLPAVKFNSLCAHPTNSRVLYLATDTGVRVSRNRGSTWRSMGVGLPNAPVMQVFVEDGYLYAVTFGRGLWRARVTGR